MKTFRKWNKKAVEDNITVMSKEAKSFVTAFRNYLKRNLPAGYEVESLSAGHYYCSGFVKKGDKYIYLSYDIPRYGEVINFETSGLEGVLYRTAKNNKDFTGGPNNFCSINNIVKNITLLMERQ